MYAEYVGVESRHHGGHEARDEGQMRVREENAQILVCLEAAEAHEVGDGLYDIQGCDILAVKRVHRQNDAHEAVQRVEGVLNGSVRVVVVVHVEEREGKVVDPLRVAKPLVDDGEGVEDLHDGFAVLFEPLVLGGAPHVETYLLVVWTLLELDGGVGRGRT